MGLVDGVGQMDGVPTLRGREKGDERREKGKERRREKIGESVPLSCGRHVSI